MMVAASTSHACASACAQLHSHVLWPAGVPASSCCQLCLYP